MQKKKSAQQSSTTQRPDTKRPVFFVDRDLGIHFYTDLSQDGRFRVEFHDHHFTDGPTGDREWLGLIASRGWVGITHDRRIRRDHRQFIERSGACIIIVVGRWPLSEQASNFIATYPTIERFVRKHNGPYTAKLYQPTEKERKRRRPKGRIELWGDW